MNCRLLTLFIVTLFFGELHLLAQNKITELVSDGPDGIDTYDLINDKLGDGSNVIEAPDCTHSPEVRHIFEVFDTDLQKNVFRFDIHRDIDDDRCKGNTDKQRNEIKTFGNSPEFLLARRGELVEYNWKFKIDADFQPGSGFTHLFQIKAVGGQDGSPVITITPRRKSFGTNNRMELIHRNDTPSGVSNNIKIRDLPLSDFLGKWLEVTCVMYVNGNSDEIAANVDGVYTDFQEPGTLDLEIKEVSSGTVLMSYKSMDIDMDRNMEGTSSFQFNRPKWGIYRSLSDKEFLRDESVLFADFKITEFDQALGIEDFDITGATIQKNPIQDILSINPDLQGSVFSVHTITGQKILSTSSTEIDLSDRARGLYFLNIEKEAKIANIKFLLE